MLLEDVDEQGVYMLIGLKARPELNGTEVTCLLKYEERVCVKSWKTAKASESSLQT